MSLLLEQEPTAAWSKRWLRLGRPSPSLGRIRLTSALVLRLARWPALAAALRARPRLVEWLVGFRRPFPSRAAAAREAARFLGSTHFTRANLREHYRLSSEQRVSDYPMLFHFARIGGDGPLSVFDLGGSLGNLYYISARYLDRPLRWTCLDLPHVVRIGARLARRRGLHARLRFTTELAAAAESEVLLASGALHFFETPLPEMLAGLARQPAHVLINRMPLAPRGPVHTVQDARFGLADCTLYDRDTLVADMAGLGYELVDEWRIWDMRLEIPLHPDRSAIHYSGLYFRRA